MKEAAKRRATQQAKAAPEREYEGQLPFTLKELRDAIPAELFQRSLFWSSAYLLLDVVIACAFFYAATYIDTLSSTLLRYILWPTYWYFQGLVMTGMWVIAHECGHQAFSDYRAVNDAVGWVFHSFLLVPYHSWRISHGMHHKHNAQMEMDQVFVPPVESKVSRKPLLWGNPIKNAAGISVMLIAGWLAYLISNTSGQDYGKRTNHFEPKSPIFQLPGVDENERRLKKLWYRSVNFLVLVSDFGLVITLAALAYCAYQWSFLHVVKYYLVPYMIVNAWLVIITFLQHTDITVPHFRGAEWNFMKGALATVDRDYGTFFNVALHHINDSHVVHHLFSTMPHYNAVKATPYLKKALGQYYLFDDTSITKSVYKSWADCHFVDDDGLVIFYRSTHA